MKYAIIECRETYCPDDRPINLDYIVKYDRNFVKNCEKIEKLQKAMLDYNYEDDIDEEDMELLKKYYLDENGEGGSTIQAVENFIQDHFKVISPYTSYSIEW